MDRKRAIQWAAIIGLVSGFIALGTAVIALNNEVGRSQESAREQQQRTAEYQQKLESDRAAYEEQRRIDLAAQQAALQAQQRANLCNEHASRRVAIESRFSSLMESHGTLMNAIRSCTRQANQDDRSNCLATVCIGAAIWTDGNANCLEVAADAEAIKQDMARENQAAGQDGCSIPSSQIMTYFN